MKTDCAAIRPILLPKYFKIRSKGEPVSISRGMMETMRETPHGNSIPPFSTSPLPTQTRLEQRSQSGGEDEAMSDNEFSRDGDSPDALSRVPPTDVDPETLEKLRQQEREEREEIERELKAQQQAREAAAAALAVSNAGQLNLFRDTSGDGGSGENNNGTGSTTNVSSTASSLAAAALAVAASKEPPPLGLAGLEAFRREYLTSPLSHLRGNDSGIRGIPPSLLPPFPPLMPQLPGSGPMSLSESSFNRTNTNRSSLSGGGTPPGGDRGGHGSAHSTPSSEFSSQQNWSFEEQFKQLYELSDDSKRKDFLDDLFAFMQKRGTPINRLPIMAKQVLDLYELYNLVVGRGGLVEVINKKQWQEIIKGLNLPSSITSAAFTLRTQYTKYVYPYECHMKNLSSPTELQQAIDGNRREGRRAGYESYNMFPGPRPHIPLPPSSLPLPQISPLPPGFRPSFNGTGFPGNLLNPGKQSPGPGFNPANPLSALEMTRLALFKMYNQAGLPGSPGGPQPPQGLGSFGQAMGQEVGRAMAEQHARALQAVREAEERDKKEEAECIEAEKRRERENDIRKEERERPDRHRDRERDRSERDHRVRPRTPDEDVLLDGEEDDALSPPPMKRERSDSTEGRTNGGGAIGGANIRIASRGESGDKSLVVSLEINSIMYQGVLFAQPTSSPLRGKQVPNNSANNTNSLTSNISERKDNRIS